MIMTYHPIITVEISYSFRAESGLMALSHSFMVILGQETNLGQGHNTLHLLIGVKGYFTCQNRQPHTTLPIYIATKPPDEVIQQEHPSK